MAQALATTVVVASLYALLGAGYVLVYRLRFQGPHAPSTAAAWSLDPAAAAPGRRRRVHLRPGDGRRSRRALRRAVRLPEGLAARHSHARGRRARAARLSARYRLPRRLRPVVGSRRLRRRAGRHDLFEQRAPRTV